MPAPARSRKIRTLQLIAIVFFTVSGGPYGLEPLLAYAGEHAALLILLITPLLWDIPAILTVLELNSMMPVTGGYYQWVKYALGQRWGFLKDGGRGCTLLLTWPFTRYYLLNMRLTFFRSWPPIK